MLNFFAILLIIFIGILLLVFKKRSFKKLINQSNLNSIKLKKNKKSKLVVLDIPLLVENKINKRKDILIFIQSNKSEILKRLKKRQNFNSKIMNRFRKIQLPLDYKRKKSNFIIKNNFTNKFIKKQIKYILNQIY